MSDQQGITPTPTPQMTEVGSIPSVSPPPVATLPEKEIPVPPPIVPTEPAPMVQEAPSLEPSGAPTPVPVETSTPEPIAPPITPEPIATAPSPEPMTPAPVPVAPIPEVPPVSPSAPTVETPVEAPPKKSNAGKIIAGVIGVLLLAGAVGTGVFLTQQSQENRSPAFAPGTPIPTPITLAAATPIPIKYIGGYYTWDEKDGLSIFGPIIRLPTKDNDTLDVRVPTADGSQTIFTITPAANQKMATLTKSLNVGDNVLVHVKMDADTATIAITAAGQKHAVTVGPLADITKI